MTPKRVFIVYIVYVNILAVKSCDNHKTCRDCFQDPKDCVWCASDIVPDYMQRCQPRSLDANWCPGPLEIRKNSNFSLVRDENFRDDLQIKPQKYDVTLLPGQTITLDFAFRGAKNYPVDVYFLADMSKSMETSRKDAADMSGHIFETLRGLTSNVRLGFGAFIDKNTFPYTLAPNKSLSYSFKHYLNPTTDYRQFEIMIKGVNGGINHDLPEGGFDALAQVLACENQVGWKPKARRIVVFLSNAPQHTVGDGRTAGIFKPYDGKCHTNSDGVYTEELNMDYPSVAQINKLASDKGVTIIWTMPATTDANEKKLFTDILIKHVRGSKTAILTEKQSIVHNLQNIYKEISTNTILKAKVQSNNDYKFNINFDPDCTKGNAKNDRKVDCAVKLEEDRNFKVNITLKEYYKQNKESVDISFEGVDEKLTLNISIDVGCACEENKVINSADCNGETLKCGVCECGASKSGARCQCSGSGVADDGTSIGHEESCIAPYAPLKEKCSGYADYCVCGLCQCKGSRHGKYCQYDFSRCPGYQNGTECNNHGVCSVIPEPDGDKYVCTCEPGWRNPPGQKDGGCTCSDATDACVTNGVVCNGRGRCECNACKCDDIPQWDKRVRQTTSCQILDCPECHSLQCDALRACVLCLLNQDKCEDVCAANIEIEEKHTELPQEYLNLNTKEWQLCKNQKVGSCNTKFVYKYDDKNHKILMRIEKNLVCAQEYYMYGGILLLTLLLVGIFTLLAWKCLIRYQDRKEYEKFEREHNSILSSPCRNPLYNEPRTFFRNPAFVASVNENDNE